MRPENRSENIGIHAPFSAYVFLCDIRSVPHEGRNRSLEPCNVNVAFWLHTFLICILTCLSLSLSLCVSGLPGHWHGLLMNGDGAPSSRSTPPARCPTGRSSVSFTLELPPQILPTSSGDSSARTHATTRLGADANFSQYFAQYFLTCSLPPLTKVPVLQVTPPLPEVQHRALCWHTELHSALKPRPLPSAQRRGGFKRITG